MKSIRITTAAVLLMASLGALAQTNTAETVQRDVNQQNRIQDGLQNGSLNVKEAGRLESEQARVDRLQAQALSDGKLSGAERQRLDNAQDKVSQDIRAAKTNDVSGNPNSASNQRMQADVQRNINQNTRIEQGVQSGNLTNREVSALQSGQARTTAQQAVAAKDGRIGANEQATLQNRQDNQSGRIFDEKHDGATRTPPVTAASTVQRDINQQNRIQDGLQSGSLNVKEAGRLESEQARVDRLQSNALSDGKLTTGERQRLDNAQDRVSQDIRAAKTNDVKGNPNSVSNQRMQANVQRNINQNTRIEQGIQSGELRNTEVAKLQRGQAHSARREAAAAKDGHVGAKEQAAIQNGDNNQSEKIHNKKHNAAERKG